MLADDERRYSYEIGHYRGKIIVSISNALGKAATSPVLFIDTGKVVGGFRFGKLYDDNENTIGLIVEETDYIRSRSGTLTLGAITTDVLYSDGSGIKCYTNFADTQPNGSDILMDLQRRRIKERSGSPLLMGDYRRLDESVKALAKPISESMRMMRN